jgi:hypothetical protein
MKGSFSNSYLSTVRRDRNGSVPMDRRIFLKSSLLAGKEIVAMETVVPLQVAGAASPAAIAAAGRLDF